MQLLLWVEAKKYEMAALQNCPVRGRVDHLVPALDPKRCWQAFDYLPRDIEQQTRDRAT